MSWMITIIVGIFMGLLAGLISVGVRRGGMLVNLINGIVGAIFGYWLFVDVMGLGPRITSAGFFSGIVLIWEIIGAVVFLAIVNAIYYGEISGIESRESRMYGRETAHEYKKRSWKDRDK